MDRPLRDSSSRTDEMFELGRHVRVSGGYGEIFTMHRPRLSFKVPPSKREALKAWVKFAGYGS